MNKLQFDQKLKSKIRIVSNLCKKLKFELSYNQEIDLFIVMKQSQLIVANKDINHVYKKLQKDGTIY